MRRATAATGVSTFLLLGAVAGHTALGLRSTVERIRYIGTVTYSRIVVDLSAPSTYSVQNVPANAAAGTPDRLVIDVDAAKIGPEARDPLSIGDSLLRGIRTGQFTGDTARIVLDLTAKVRVRTFLLPDPFRLVIDLNGDGRSGGGAPTEVIRLGSGGASRTLPGTERRPPARAEVAVRQRQRDEGPAAALPGRRFKVMLDPGHGGKDPGARGVRGLEEKDVVLSIAHLVAARLRSESEIEVLLTRTDDRYLSLEDRTGLANAAGADLFISIHANAAPSPSLRGIEVYYLNNTNNRGTLRLAAMENNLRWDPRDPSLPSAIPDLSYILSDLRQTYKVEESRQLADQLDAALYARLADNYQGIQNLGVKEGPFYVLVGAYMPCVLVEVSFLTHPVEGARLATIAYRSTLADGISQGVHRYRAQAKLAKTL